MATLSDKVNRTLVRRGGQLVEEVIPTSQLAGQAGLTAPPTLPGSVAALGGTAKQQDMAGSVAQKTSALRQSLDTQNTLQEAEADKRYRSAMTAGESAQSEKQRRLGEVLGSTQEKVQSLIDVEMNKQQAAAAPALATTGVLTASKGIAPATPEEQAGVDASFAALLKQMSSGSGPTDPVVQRIINSLSASTGQTPEQIAAAAAAAANTQANTGAGAAAAGTVTNTINVGSLLAVDPATGQNALGTTREELSQLLGISPAAIDGMSIDALNEAVVATATQGPDLSVAETDAASQSGLLGAAERAAMRERSRELSTSGVASSEAQLLDLGAALESADRVKFGGRDYSVEELLSDDTISKLVTDYLMAAPDSDIRKKLEADPNAAGLLKFVNQYKDALTSVAQQVGAAATENMAIQGANASLSNVAPNVDIPDELMATVYGSEWGQPGVAKLAPKGFVASIQGMSPGDRERLAGPLSEFLQMATTNPRVQKDLQGMSTDDFNKLFTGYNSNGMTAWEQLSANNKAADTLSRSRNDIDSLVDLYFGSSGVDESALLQTNAQRMSLGLPGDPKLDVLDSNHDGKLDKNASNRIYKELSTGISSANSPREVLDGNTGWTPAKQGANSLTGDEGWVYNTIGPAIQKQGLFKAVENSLKGIDWAKPYVPGGVSGPDVEYLKAVLRLPKFSSAVNPALYTKVRDTLDIQLVRSGQADQATKDRVVAKQQGVNPDLIRKNREMAEAEAKKPKQGTIANPNALMTE